jgi:hypothetical protein
MASATESECIARVLVLPTVITIVHTCTTFINVFCALIIHNLHSMYHPHTLSVWQLLCLGVASVAAFTTPCGKGSVPFPVTTSPVVGQVSLAYQCEQDTRVFAECMHFLDRNLPDFDEANKGSLGFVTLNPTDGVAVNEGIATLGTNMSLQTRTMYHWAAAVPKDIFLEYVLPYGNVNEARTNWRQLMFPVVQGILLGTGDDLDTYTTSDVVSAVNNALWYGPMGKDIVFKSSQTPLIYDPMSVLAFGYGSCTGVSIFFINALRSIGIPARIAGTPAWNGVTANGNHNWVEVWDVSTGWQFIEAAPAATGETLDNPCDKWFCTPSNMAGTKFFAARFLQMDPIRYPMAWDLSNTQIPGDNRTEYYQNACNAC